MHSSDNQILHLFCEEGIILSGLKNDMIKNLVQRYYRNILQQHQFHNFPDSSLFIFMFHRLIDRVKFRKEIRCHIAYLLKSTTPKVESWMSRKRFSCCRYAWW